MQLAREELPDRLPDVEAAQEQHLELAAVEPEGLAEVAADKHYWRLTSETVVPKSLKISVTTP